MRLEGKTAIVIGAGQGPGEGMGNGRATALRFAQEGAKVMAVDRDLQSAEETVSMVKQKRGDCVAFEADVTKEATLAGAIAAAQNRWGRVDILHYNVGVSIAGGDAPLLDFTEDAFDRISAINLRGAIMACKHVIPIMRQQRAGAITMISSLAALEKYPYVAYKATKAAMIAFTKQVAIQNAEYGIRANVILPGLMDTPMAVDTCPGERQEPRRGCRGARCPRAAAPQDGHRLGRGQCSSSSPPTRPISSPASLSSLTAAPRSISAEFTATSFDVLLSSGICNPLSAQFKNSSANDVSMC
jgi:NAD(P)-dependent dehydrogenase (short-subunit alcohol dehydrogenase family)